MVVDCGRFIFSWSSSKLASAACRGALDRRFTLTMVIVPPIVAIGLAIQLRKNGYLGGARIQPRGEPRFDFKVGARVGQAYATYPLGRFSVTPEQMAIVTGFRSVVLDRASVSRIRAERRVFAKVIRFETREDSAGRLVVYSRDMDRLLATLLDLGWPVA